MKPEKQCNNLDRNVIADLHRGFQVIKKKQKITLEQKILTLAQKSNKSAGEYV